MKLSIPVGAVWAALTSLCICAGSALAQSYPAKPVRLIVPFDPGGSTDIIGRTLGTKLNEYWDQTVLVENRPGASTQIGTSAVARAAPDGYTLLITPASFATNPTLYAGKLPYDTVNDFTPIVLINTSPLVLVVNPNSPYKSVKDLIGAAKVKPGSLNFGSSAIGGSNHLSGELFNVMAGLKTVHVPYKGNAPALTDLVAGRVDFIFNGTTSVLPLIQSNKLRPLGVTGRARIAALPDIPTMDQAGLKGFESTAWNGLAGPARLAAAIVSKLNADANKAITSSEMQQRLKADGSDAGGGTPAQFNAFLKSEMDKWAKVIKFANVTPE